MRAPINRLCLSQHARGELHDRRTEPAAVRGREKPAQDQSQDAGASGLLAAGHCLDVHGAKSVVVLQQCADGAVQRVPDLSQRRQDQGRGDRRPDHHRHAEIARCQWQEPGGRGARGAAARQ